MNYQQQLEHKSNLLKEHLKSSNLSLSALPEISIYPSSENHYRVRCEFRIWHDNGKLHYAMSKQGLPINNANVIFINQFILANKQINELMPILLSAIEDNEILKHKIYQIDFLSSQLGEMVVTLIYHKKLDEEWQLLANKLRIDLNIDLIGRSRRQKIIFGKDYVNECINIADKKYYYRHYENNFCQPNIEICNYMLQWAQQNTLNNNVYGNGDLLELYCGSGNFTLPLAANFNKVFATEINKNAIAALKINIAINAIENIKFARLSAAEFAAAWRKERIFKRLQSAAIELDDYDFKTVFVDPPRSGIDLQTLQLLQKIPRIIYFSCNVQTLAENLRVLCTTHRIVQIALFDQFPNTHHIESAIILQSNKP